MTEAIDQLELPSSWDIRAINAICQKPQYGFTESATAQPIGPHFLRITDIDEGRVDWAAVPFCRCSEDEIPRYRLQHNDILFARIGATTGKSFLVKHPPDSVFASYLIRLRTSESVSPDFLFYFFNSGFYWSQVNANKFASLKGGINGAILSELRVIMPPLPEQKKIAAVLSKIQQGIELEAALARNARELKSATMRRLFSAGLRSEDQKETPVGLIPESWDIASLETLGRIGNGSTPKRTNPAYWMRGKTPWLTSGKIHEGVITSADEFVTELAVQECHLPMVKAGSVLVAITGQGKTLGNAALVTFDTCISQHLAYIQFTNQGVIPGFVVLFLQSRYEELHRAGQAGGSTKGALTCSFLRNYRMPLPPPGEQEEITEILQAIDRKIAVHDAKQQAWQDLFKTMLHKLMTAQIRVNDLDIDTRELEA